MIEYFKAFDGVCFEDRAQHLEEYARNHPLTELTAEEQQAAELADYDTGQPVETAYNKEFMVFGSKMRQEGKEVTPNTFLEYLTEKGIFNMEFATSDGGHAKPTEEGYREWANKQVDEYFTMEPDPKPNLSMH
ncbi:MAG: hypothetical protein LBL17_01575 [Coxiellaceae bacterium]|nr:hypothetical protein [Coxiellaceae bacterium]